MNTVSGVKERRVGCDEKRGTKRRKERREKGERKRRKGRRVNVKKERGRKRRGGGFLLEVKRMEKKESMFTSSLSFLFSSPQVEHPLLFLPLSFFTP